MNTNTNKIFEKLAKVKEAKSKQELGAIEDAINEASSNADSYLKSMDSTYKELDNAIAETLDAISGELERISNLKQSLSEKYMSDNEAFQEINNELLDNNIENSKSNQDIVYEMTGNFYDMISNIERLLEFSVSNY